MSKQLTLPKESQEVLEHYFNLKLGGKKVRSPYYINETYDENYKKVYQSSKELDRFKKKNTKKRSLIGKGYPYEIEKTVEDFAEKYHFDLKKADTGEVREFMQEHGIGIDCSGFVVWILNGLFKQKYQKPIWDFIDFKTNNLFRRTIFKLRPVENISVRILIQNSKLIDNILKIKVGDLVIAWKNQHVLLVNRVGYNSKGYPASFEYINSTWWYGDQNGVRKGTVLITNPKGYLTDQKWDDLCVGKDWTLEGIKESGKIMRLLALY